MILDELLPLGPRALRARLDAAHAIDPGVLDDTEYHGIALGNPRFVELLTWQTFKKVFRRDPATGVLRGWNVAVEQRGPHGPFVDRLRGGAPAAYWPYVVVPAEGYRLPGPWSHGLMIDYGLPPRAAFGQHLVRDPLLALVPGSADLLLGVSYLDLGFARPMIPAWFALVRGGPLTYDAYPS